MRVEVVAVGTELLLGDIVNSNAGEIGRALAEAGLDCHHHVSVGDNEERIAEALATALARADAVVVTGGIGPTQDDVTREAVTRATGRALVRDPAIERWLRERFASFGLPMPEMNLRQADVPEGATVIEQRLGTAPGLIVPHGNGVIYCIPGVPREMREMLARAVLPDLRARAGEVSPIVTRVIRTAGVGESGVADTLRPLWDGIDDRVRLSFLAGGGEVRVRLTARATDADAVEQTTLLVREALGVAVVGVDDQTLEVVVGELLRARSWTLGAAESLTGGALGARVTSVPGASDYFRGSVVAYANDVKHAALGVPAALLEEHGAVSAEVARAMAAGARAVLGCDVAVALTGVAGPAALGREPGTVVLGLSRAAGEDHRELRLPGDRETVRQLAVSAGLNFVRLALLEA
ncbi:MAG TPA: competence/damage-inducible protein A [Actinomycetota bacterium]